MAMVLSISETHPAPPCSIVILGASGDLAKRKLLPALYNLEQCGIGLLPPETSILGFARTQMSTEAFRTTSHEAVKKYSRLKVDEECWRKFEGKLDYLSGLDQPDAFKRLRQRLEESEKARGLPPNRVFYFSIPPEAIRESIERLDEAGLIRDPHDKYFSRVVVEKPIGHDLPSAIEISNTMRQHLDESQIFRIDHYLGKETVQNLLVLRFANTIFERLWGSRNVSHVQITVAETEETSVGLAPVTTIIRARCATWCKITCCRCSRCLRWSRRCPSMRPRSANPSSTCCARCGPSRSMTQAS